MLSAAFWKMAALLPSVVSFGSSRRERSTRNPSFEVSQIPPAGGDGCIGSGQDHSQLRLSQQRTFNLQAQPPDLGAISHFKSKPSCDEPLSGVLNCTLMAVCT